MIFDKEKVTQITSYFLWKHKGFMPYIKLLKLVYLADREALLSLGDTLTGDSFIAMKLGPVPYFTYNSLKQNNLPNNWLVIEGYNVKLVKQINENDPLETFDLISPEIAELLDSIIEKYGMYEKYTLCNLTHKICPEWEQCKNYSIELSDILRASGKTEKEIETTLSTIFENDRLLEFSDSLK